jgi:hypothetical protein
MIRKALFVARVVNFYLVAYQVTIGLQHLQRTPAPLDCEIVGPYSLVCTPVAP